MIDSRVTGNLAIVHLGLVAMSSSHFLVACSAVVECPLEYFCNGKTNELPGAHSDYTHVVGYSNDRRKGQGLVSFLTHEAK